MRALEKFQRLAMENEESATNTETSVDVAVKVAEEVEAESQLAESIAVAEDAIEVSEEAAEDTEQLEMWEDSIRQHGVTPQGLQLMSFRGILSSLAHRDLPAAESLSSIGRNPEAEQIALEAVQNAQKGYWQTLKNFLKTIWEKIQAAISWLMQRFSSWEGNLKKMGAALSKLTIDDAKLREKKVKIMSHQQFGVLALLPANDRRQHHNFRAFRQGHYLIYNLVYGLLLNLLSAHRAMRDPDSGIQKPEIIIDLRYGADCGSRVFRGGFLINGNSRRQAFDVVHIRLFHLA